MSTFPSINDSLTNEERQSFYGAMIGSCRDALVIIDQDGRIAEWNVLAVNMFGYTHDEAVGSLMHELIVPPDLVAPHRAAMTRYLATREPRIIGTRVEVEALRKNGERFPIELTISHMPFRGYYYFVSRIRDISTRRQRERHIELVAKELHHRVKNVLTIFMSIARKTARTAPNLRSFIDTFEGRVMAYKATHDVLDITRSEGVDLETLFRSSFAPYPDNPKSFTGPRVFVPAKAALTLGMCVHEMTTNAVKHGAFSVAHGSVDVVWTLDEHELAITWTERGGPAPSPGHHGFGSDLIRMGLKTDLKGSMIVKYPHTGLVGRVTIPAYVIGNAT